MVPSKSVMLQELNRINETMEEFRTMVLHLSTKLEDIEVRQMQMRNEVAGFMSQIAAKLSMLSTQPQAGPAATLTLNLAYKDALKAILPPDLSPEGVALSINPADPNFLSAVEQKYAREGKKIDAIKEFRHRTGYGLKESKDAIEAWMVKNGLGMNHPY